jgi:hypothetical protein
VPIYIVSPGNRLIRANTYGQAVNYAAKAMFKAIPVKAEILADMLREGAKIEDARAPVNQELPLETASPAVTLEQNGSTVTIVTHAAEPAPTLTLTDLPATGGPLEPEHVPPLVVFTPGEPSAQPDEYLEGIVKRGGPQIELEPEPARGRFCQHGMPEHARCFSCEDIRSMERVTTLHDPVPVIPQPDDIDTVTLEGIDHVQ